MSADSEAKTRRARPVADLELVVHSETDGAFFVSIDGVAKHRVCLPKSQVFEISWRRRATKIDGGFMPDVSDCPRILGVAQMRIPEIVAAEKGFF